MFRSWSGPGVCRAHARRPQRLSGVCPLRLEDVSYSIAGLDLLAGVNLELARGESVAVGVERLRQVDPAFDHIGLITPTGGHVRVADTDMNKVSEVFGAAPARSDRCGLPGG